MSHVRLVSVALAGLVLSTLGAAPPNSAPLATAPKAPETTEQLLSRLVESNNELKARNAKLEAEVKFLQTQLITQQRTLGIEPKNVPPGWKQGSINGLTFYVVPCGDDQQSASKTVVKLLDK